MQIHFDVQEVRIMNAEGREVFRSRLVSGRTPSGVGFVSKDRLTEEIPEGTVEVWFAGMDKPLVTQIRRFVPGSYFECAMSLSWV